MSRVLAAATWNLYHSTSAKALTPALERLRRRGTSVLLLQEANDTGLRDTVKWLREHGLDVHRRGQLAVAWDPRRWTCAGKDGGRLSDTPWYRPGGADEVWSGYASVVLADPWGRTLEALSYHTPSHVQVARPPARRLRATRESMDALEDRARASLCDAQLYAGDDNVDERRQPSRWRFMTSTPPLRLVQAPAATHAGGRRLDDFRVAGLAAREGLVVANPSDHHAHWRQFAFPN